MNDDLLTEKILAEHWTYLIDWTKRAQGDKGFFESILRHGYRAHHKLFDAALGDGYDTIQLLKAGFDVTSNEVNKDFEAMAKKNAKIHGVELKLTQGYDWRNIPNSFEESYDAVLCMGNSFTYMPTLDDKKQALANFHKLLTPKGRLVIDIRNYDYIIDEQKSFEKNPRKNFRFSKEYYYCGAGFDIYPVKINADNVVVEQYNKGNNTITRSRFYMIRRQDMLNLLNDSGYKVKFNFADFMPIVKDENQKDDITNADFYQFVAEKQ